MRSPASPIRSASRASLAIPTAVLFAALTLVGCSAASTPVATLAPTVGPSLTTAVASASVATSPTVGPTATVASSPTVAPSSPAACPASIAAGIAPSDWLTGVTFSSGIGVDKITFTFGTSTGIPSGTDPTGELHPTSPPFSLGGSGQAVDVAGQRFIAVTFRGMAIADEQGNPSYTGPSDIRPNALAVRELRLVDDFEGVITWIVGVDGPGCVAVSRLTGPSRIVVSVTQP